MDTYYHPSKFYLHLIKVTDKDQNDAKLLLLYTQKQTTIYFDT